MLAISDEIENECFCGECAKVVQNADKAFCCDGYEEWFHIKCTEVPESVYDLSPITIADKLSR